MLVTGVQYSDSTHRHHSVLIMIRVLLQKGFSKRKVFHMKRTCFLFVALHETRFTLIQISKCLLKSPWHKGLWGHAASACLRIGQAGHRPCGTCNLAGQTGLCIAQVFQLLLAFELSLYLTLLLIFSFFICKATFQPQQTALPFIPEETQTCRGWGVMRDTANPRDLVTRCNFYNVLASISSSVRHIFK